jgi:beta-galactosidase
MFFIKTVLPAPIKQIFVTLCPPTFFLWREHRTTCVQGQIGECFGNLRWEDLMSRQPELGVCYYPEHWPEVMWAQDAADMTAAGITHVRVGEFAWSRFEPEPGHYEFEWLAQAIDVLADAGLKIILGTPTATPPKWLVDRMPDMLPVDRNGRVRGFGSRRHYCFSHMGYRQECARITRAMAERFGDHPAVVSWQTDNEYGCHDSVHSYSQAATENFRRWLEQRYDRVAALNEAWGNVFWSMEYRSFEEIELPDQGVTETNPAHRWDYRRFASDEVKAFNKVQTEILRDLSPGRDLVHNFMTFFTDFDHFSVSEELDVASWDSYPIGSLDMMPVSQNHKQHFVRTGDPDIQSFHHDLYRACGRGRFWIMEQQPGPVNWAPYNPDPLPGMLRLWGWEAIAHGAELVSYFRWRQAPFAQEQFHAGLNRPDGSPDRGLEEVAQLGRELAALPDIKAAAQADIAIVFSYDSLWALEVQPQGKNFSYVGQALAIYRVLREMGLDVDFIAPDTRLDGYRVVVLPTQIHVDDGLAARLARFDGDLIVLPRTGSRTESHSIPANLAPGPLQDLLGVTVTRAESFRSHSPIDVDYQSKGYTFDRWREFVEADADVVASTNDGHPAITRKENAYYLAGWPDEALLKQFLTVRVAAAGLSSVPLPFGVRTRTRGNYRFFVNYNPQPVSIASCITGDLVLGDADMSPADVAVEKMF